MLKKKLQELRQLRSCKQLKLKLLKKPRQLRLRQLKKLQRLLQPLKKPDLKLNKRLKSFYWSKN